jgi:hypothetical protein
VDYAHCLSVPIAVAERAGLRCAFAVAGIALALGLGCAAVGLVVGGGAELAPAERAPASRWWWVPWFETSLVVAVAGAAVWAMLGVSQPLVRENADPLDVRFAHVYCGRCSPPALAMEGVGPHALREAPVVEFGTTTNRIDGLPASPEELFAILKNKRELWQEVNPGRAFPGMLLANPRGLGRVSELESRLGTALDAGYPEVDLWFTEQRFESRPLFGEGYGRRHTALRVRVARTPEECGPPPPRLVHLGPHAEDPVVGFLEDLVRRHGDGSVPCLILRPR